MNNLPDTTSRMPSVFVGVGSPRQMWDEEWCGELKQWADTMPRPKAILLFSAHWLHYPVMIGATKPVPLVYDYYNFPRHFYEVQYPAPNAPELAGRFRELLADELEIEDSERGLDHGAFVGLMGMYPDAGVPVLEVSIPTFDPESLFAIGHILAPLRDEGVMIMGAGLLTHSAQSAEANRAFDAWVVETLEKRDLDSLFRYQDIAPGVQQALPTVEHFVPLLVAYGAAYESGGEVTTGVGGFSQGGGSRRSLRFD
jgi:4,5-DOPA dioxygenase extradiol